MASQIFATSSIESFAPIYPIIAMDFSDTNYENIWMNLDEVKIASPAAMHPISTTDFLEMGCGNVLTDLDEEKLLNSIFNEGINTTNNDANSVQTSDDDMQEFMREFVLISPKDTKPQLSYTLDNSEENLSRSSEYKPVSPNTENDQSLLFTDISQTTQSSPEASSSPVTTPKPSININNIPLSFRQQRYRSLKLSQVCEVCGKAFRTRQHLQRHRLEKHAEDLCLDLVPYTCQQCNKHFKRREHLQIHQRTKHSNVKDYKCETCGKEFVTKSHLKRHMLYHERTKTKTASICTGCGRAFARKGNLAKHVANGCIGIRSPGA
ncbi:zinc finger protein 45 [Nasonia vitripennis]|uniref:C2H2-type domain-containing protein n=1 Tax=Nasonia vitripennis TaxID=7425 RepID=A0A7M7GEQ4_NASVI|nr:zinc finger protein 45 [Nasonia vitripennis]